MLLILPVHEAYLWQLRRAGLAGIVRAGRAHEQIVCMAAGLGLLEQVLLRAVHDHRDWLHRRLRHAGLQPKHLSQRLFLVEGADLRSAFGLSKMFHIYNYP